MDVTKELNQLTQMESELELAQAEFNAKMQELQSDPAYQNFIQLESAVNNKRKELKEQVFEAMVATDTKTVDTDSIRVTVAERKNFKAEDIDKVPTDFIKFSLDTTRVNKHYKLYGELPEGVDMSETKYLLWKDK